MEIYELLKAPSLLKCATLVINVAIAVFLVLNLRAAEKLGIAADACLVIEDALSGIAAAKAGKIRVAAIPDTRFVDPSDYKNEADYLLGSLSEIPALIRRVSIM